MQVTALGKGAAGAAAGGDWDYKPATEPWSEQEQHKKVRGGVLLPGILEVHHTCNKPVSEPRGEQEQHKKVRPVRFQTIQCCWKFPACSAPCSMIVLSWKPEAFVSRACLEQVGPLPCAAH